MSDAPRKIVTENVYPPIPIRRFDWCAYFDGDDEGLQGWGATEREAIADLRHHAEEDCNICHHVPPPRSCLIGGCPHGRDL